MPIKNDTHAVNLITISLPNSLNALVSIRSDDLRYVPNAVRRYVKRRTRHALESSGRMSEPELFVETRADLTRLNICAIERCLRTFNTELST